MRTRGLCELTGTTASLVSAIGDCGTFPEKLHPEAWRAFTASSPSGTRAARRAYRGSRDSPSMICRLM